MYLRTTTRRNANGQRVSYYQLAKNVWDADRGYSVARVIYNFGRADQVDRDMLQASKRDPVWDVQVHQRDGRVRLKPE
jgi:hypothetical protein